MSGGAGGSGPARPPRPGGGSPPVPPWGVLVVAVLAMSWAGPLVRLSAAPALAIAAWRLTMSVAFIAMVLVLRPGGIGMRLGRGEWTLAVASGVLLAGHFWAWIASISLTTVASSVVLVSTQPIFVALLSAALLGERAGRREWMGIVLGVAGAAVIGWGDFGRGREALLGDLLAVLGAVLVSGYYVIGRRLRQRLDLWAYTGVVYGLAAMLLLAAAAATPGVPLVDYPAREWLIFFLLAAGPMMLGHTGVNYAIRYVRAYAANLVILAEPVGATLIAWLLPQIREVPPPQTVVGGAMILAGIALGVATRSPRPTADRAMDDRSGAC